MKLTTNQKVCILGAILVVIGAFSPWATWGFFSVAGTSGDGVITLIVGLVVGASSFSPPSNKKRIAYLGLGLIIILIGCVDASNVAGIAAAPFGIQVKIGSGLWLTILGGLLIFGSGLMPVPARRKPKRARA